MMFEDLFLSDASAHAHAQDVFADAPVAHLDFTSLPRPAKLTSFLDTQGCTVNGLSRAKVATTHSRTAAHTFFNEEAAKSEESFLGKMVPNKLKEAVGAGKEGDHKGDHAEVDVEKIKAKGAKAKKAAAESGAADEPKKKKKDEKADSKKKEGGDDKEKDEDGNGDEDDDAPAP